MTVVKEDNVCFMDNSCVSEKISMTMPNSPTESGKSVQEPLSFICRIPLNKFKLNNKPLPTFDNQISQSFMCTYCNRKFHSIELRKKHVVRSHRRYQSCIYCKKRIKNVQKLYEHFEKTHLDTFIGCVQCCERFETIEQLRLHNVLLHYSLPTNETDEQLTSSLITFSDLQNIFKLPDSNPESILNTINSSESSHKRLLPTCTEQIAKSNQKTKSLADLGICTQLNVYNRYNKFNQQVNDVKEPEFKSVLTRNKSASSTSTVPDSFLSSLGLERNVISKTKSRNTETALSKMSLSGENSLTKIHVCLVCGLLVDSYKEYIEHKEEMHPYVFSLNYELIDKQIKLINNVNVVESKSLCDRKNTSENALEVYSTAEYSRKELCLKCNKLSTDFERFHQHILVCSGLYQWMSTKRKAKKRKQSVPVTEEVTDDETVIEKVPDTVSKRVLRSADNRISTLRHRKRIVPKHSDNKFRSPQPQAVTTVGKRTKEQTRLKKSTGKRRKKGCAKKFRKKRLDKKSTVPDKKEDVPETKTEVNEIKDGDVTIPIEDKDLNNTLKFISDEDNLVVEDKSVVEDHRIVIKIKKQVPKAAVLKPSPMSLIITLKKKKKDKKKKKKSVKKEEDVVDEKEEEIKADVDKKEDEIKVDVVDKKELVKEEEEEKDDEKLVIAAEIKEEDVVNKKESVTVVEAYEQTMLAASNPLLSQAIKFSSHDKNTIDKVDSGCFVENMFSDSDPEMETNVSSLLTNDDPWTCSKSSLSELVTHVESQLSKESSDTCDAPNRIVNNCSKSPTPVPQSPIHSVTTPPILSPQVAEETMQQSSNLLPTVISPAVVPEKAAKAAPVQTEYYCDICLKYFKKEETLVKHRTTITHISKLSEIEAVEHRKRLQQEQIDLEKKKENEEEQERRWQMFTIQTEPEDLRINANKSPIRNRCNESIPVLPYNSPSVHLPLFSALPVSSSSSSSSPLLPSLTTIVNNTNATLRIPTKGAMKLYIDDTNNNNNTIPKTNSIVNNTDNLLVDELSTKSTTVLSDKCKIVGRIFRKSFSKTSNELIDHYDPLFIDKDETTEQKQVTNGFVCNVKRIKNDESQQTTVLKTNKKRAEIGIDFEKELKECIGVAGRKSQRTCTSGKQNVLTEFWSSDESVNGHGSGSDDDDEFSKKSHHKRKRKKFHSSGRPKKTISTSNGTMENSTKATDCDDFELSHKKKHSSKPVQVAEVDGNISDKSKRAVKRCRKRSSTSQLYYWSSSSSDVEFGFKDYNNDGQQQHPETEEEPQQHGWVVGDSSKKLVTLLAHSKSELC